MFFPCFWSWWPETVQVGICHFPLWPSHSSRSGGSTAPYCFIKKTVWQGQDWQEEGRHSVGDRIMMAKLLPLTWAGKQTGGLLPSTTLKPLLFYPLDGNLWHDFTNSLQNSIAPITCTGCTGGSHHIWKEDMTFLSLKCDFSNSDLPLHIFACVGFDVRPKRCSDSCEHEGGRGT